MNEEKTCPCCHNHCLLSAPGCEKGERYARGETEESSVHGHRHGRRKMPELNTTEGLLCACAHALHHRENDAMPDALSPSEREELNRLLRKLLNSWGEPRHAR